MNILGLIALAEAIETCLEYTEKHFLLLCVGVSLGCSLCLPLRKARV